MQNVRCPSAVLASIIIAFGCFAVPGQKPDTGFADTLRLAAEQRGVYLDVFRNLLSEETKTFEVFDKRGASKKKRTVVSTIIVYPLSNNEKNVAEYRNVNTVDGKSVKNSDKRAQEFFEEIVKVDSSKKELEKLEKEGSRYDEAISLNGFTLFQGVPLADNLRPYFEFKSLGSETLNDRELLFVSYEQTKASPFIITDPSRNRNPNNDLTLVFDVDLDTDRDLNARLRGKLWIDAQTFQIWKEERVLTLQPEAFPGPVVFSESKFEYQRSDFGILTPRSISYVQFEIDNRSGRSRKEAAVTFNYANFSKPNVEVRSSEVKN